MNGRYKPKPPPRNPNTTKTCDSFYHGSSEVFSCQEQNSLVPMKFSVPRGMATGNASLTHENLATSAKFNAYNTTERVRDPGAEDADVSSQSSSSSVIPRCGAKFQSNLGKVNLSEVQYANKPYNLHYIY